MKVFTGRIIATNMEKTATVTVERFAAHPIYGKRIKRTKKYHVHNDKGAKVGDLVHFVAVKPISKLKRWKITEVIDETRSKSKKKSKRSKVNKSK